MEKTPSKACFTLKNPSGCIICQKNETNKRKRKSLGGKTAPWLLRKMTDILEIPLDLLTSNAHRYICETPCSRDVENYLKYKEKAEELKNTLLEHFKANLDRRTKRGLPSDVELEDLTRSRTAKSLSFVKEVTHSQANSAQDQAQSQAVQPLLPAPVLREGTDSSNSGCCELPKCQQQILGVQHLPSHALSDNQQSNNRVHANVINLEEAKQLVVQEECQNIQITINYPSGKKTCTLPNNLQKLGKALARNASFKSIATAVLSNEKLKENIKEQICAEVAEEAKLLCSSKSPSLLRTPTKETLLKFSWDLIGKELKEKAPLTYKVLKSVAVAKIPKSQESTRRDPGVLLAAGVLLKVRDSSMSYIPYLMGLLLKAAGTSKKGIVRLNHLGICMSPKSLNQVLDKIGEDYCIKLINQQKCISSNMKQEKELKVKLESLSSQHNNCQTEIDSESDVCQDEQELQRIKGEIAMNAKERPPSFCIVLDNFDINIKASDMTSDNQNKDNHWCNHNAVIDRVNPILHSDEKPIADILDIPNKAVLPSPATMKN